MAPVRVGRGTVPGPSARPHYTTLDCGCVLDAPAPDADILFMAPACLERASQGRSRGLARANSRADQAVLVQRVMALHELDAGRGKARAGFSKSGVTR